MNGEGLFTMGTEDLGRLFIIQKIVDKKSHSLYKRTFKRLQ